MSLEKKCLSGGLSAQEIISMLESSSITLTSEQVRHLKAVVNDDTSSLSDKTKAKTLLTLHMLNHSHSAEKLRGDQQNSDPISNPGKKRKRIIPNSESDSDSDPESEVSSHTDEQKKELRPAPPSSPTYDEILGDSPTILDVKTEKRVRFVVEEAEDEEKSTAQSCLQTDEVLESSDSSDTTTSRSTISR